MALLLALAVVLQAPTAVTAAACANASTLVRGDSDREAIAYSDDCTPRLFRVLDEPGVGVSLNLSHLNLVHVQDYPRVNKLLLHNNFLTTFQEPTTEAAGSIMEELDLHDNRIADLSSLVLPRRLTKLNLASNKIATLSSFVPWPKAFELKWLSLDRNNIHSIAADAFDRLSALSYLSLSNTTLENLGDLSFPPTLQTLNLSQNLFTSDRFKFTSAPVALSTLEMSGNRLEAFPDLASLISLQDLNLANNGMRTIAGVRLPPKLKRLNLSGNAVEVFEVAQSDLKIVEGLAELIIPTDFLSSTCKNDRAKRQVVRGDLEVCVLSDDLVISPSPAGDQKTTEPPTPRPSPNLTTQNPGVLNDTKSTSESSSANSHMSNKAMLLIGGGCFAMGLIVAAYVFLVRRDGRAINSKLSQHPTFAPDASDASSRTFARGGGEPGDYTNASWVFGSPMKDVGMPVGPNNVVAILEDDRNRRGRGRSKVEDLLVYEIPLDEILIKEAISQKHHGEETMYMAEYQGYQVVMHSLTQGRSKLQRGRRRFEREFVEQVRLASLLEHVCIVQFIGVTLGSHRQSQHPNLKWTMGVVFEYMQCGSLAAIFHEERTRREGRQFRRTLSDATPKSSKEYGSTFTWYPNSQTSFTENGSPGQTSQRSKLSIALDVAMALAYLHSMGYIHGDLRAEKVLLNEQGEAKLSGMDIDLAVNVPDATPTRLDVRASAVKARMKVKTMFQTSISQSPALGSSLLNSAEATNGGIAPMAISSMTTSTLLVSANSRARRRGMQDDIYAFGLLLWELDTMMCVDAMRRLTAAPTEVGEEHQMLRFSPECPTEVQYLARRCWNPELKNRPTALDLQEEIVRMLEGRLTTLSERSRSTHRWSRRTNSRNGSSSFASSHSSSLSHSDYRSSSLVIAETEV